MHLWLPYFSKTKVWPIQLINVSQSYGHHRQSIQDDYWNSGRMVILNAFYPLMMVKKNRYFRLVFSFFSRLYLDSNTQIPITIINAIAGFFYHHHHHHPYDQYHFGYFLQRFLNSRKKNEKRMKNVNDDDDNNDCFFLVYSFLFSWWF